MTQTRSGGPRGDREKRAALGALRERANALRSASGLRRFAQALDGDARAGARALAGRCRDRAAAIDRESRRMKSLLALRGRLVAEGVRHVAGVDEVGVGPLAGPVVAAAVVLPDDPELPGLDDSKKVLRPERERLDAAIRAQALDWSVAEVWVDEIDRINVYQAALLAMRRAVEGLARVPGHLVVDARTVPGVEIPQTSIVGGDGKDASIAAASIVAKVHRDAIMERMDTRYPGYGFARHKGYGTRTHLDALRDKGPTPIHRRSFAPVAQLPLF